MCIRDRTTIDLGGDELEGATTFGGLAFAINNRFGSDANLRLTGAVPYTLIMDGSTAPRYAVYDHDVTMSCGIFLKQSTR